MRMAQFSEAAIYAVSTTRFGADIVTAGFQVYKDSFEHPFTDKGLKIFQDAWDDTELGSLVSWKCDSKVV